MNVGSVGPGRAPPSPTSLLRSLRSRLAEAGDAGRAAGMRSYMRSSMAFHGVPAPEAQAIGRALFGHLTWGSASEWSRTVALIWRRARFREERYGAIQLSGVRGARAFQTPGALPLYEEMIVSGAWWDYVDEIAIRRVGPIVRSHPRVLKRTMRAWSRDPDLWKRRTAIICQVGSKEATDLDLLADCIEPSMGSSEFFLRKAIGWALRQEARYDPDWVQRFVRANRGRLSPLSRREALRHLPDAARALAAMTRSPGP